jgi:zinc protease
MRRCGSPILAVRLGTGLLAALCVCGMLLIPSGKAQAMKIQEVKSPAGISAWLVEEHSVPLLAMRFAFDGGSAQDPDGKEGLANFLSAMLDEGAGDIDSKSFHERMEEIAMRMSFEDGRDAFFGSFETLSENRDKAFALLALALNQPRFDVDAVDRIRGQLLAALAYAARDPDRVAGEQWLAMAHRHRWATLGARICSIFVRARLPRTPCVWSSWVTSTPRRWGACSTRCLAH